MNWQEHITGDPAVLVGKPVIKGTRLAVEFILELIAEGWAEDEMLRNGQVLPANRSSPAPEDVETSIEIPPHPIPRSHLRQAILDLDCDESEVLGQSIDFHEHD